MKKLTILSGTVVAAICLLIFPMAAGATILDLTSGITSGVVNEATFTNNESQATGSGVIDSFVRISANTDVVDGYNTSVRPLGRDENSSPVFTHDLPFSAVPIVELSDGNYYWEFLLDINQASNEPYLSLDELLLYGSDDALTNYEMTLGNLGTLLYNLDGAGDSTILLNYNLNAGSGSGDLFAYIPVGEVDFTWAYLYSSFGGYVEAPPTGAAARSFVNNDGYEEWAVRTLTPVNVPEPATMLLLGAGLLGLAGLGRKKLFK